MLAGRRVNAHGRETGMPARRLAMTMNTPPRSLKRSSPAKAVRRSPRQRRCASPGLERPSRPAADIAQSVSLVIFSVISCAGISSTIDPGYGPPVLHSNSASTAAPLQRRAVGGVVLVDAGAGDALPYQRLRWGLAPGHACALRVLRVRAEHWRRPHGGGVRSHSASAAVLRACRNRCHDRGARRRCLLQSRPSSDLTPA